MGISYKFYVQMEGKTYGPYTAREVKNLNLLDEVLVTEESMNGQWLPACRFDFDDMVRKEQGIAPATPASAATPPDPVVPTPNPAKPVLNPDGTISRPAGWQPQVPPTPQPQPSPFVNNNNPNDTSSPIGWCILAFLFPIVGWILYFVWRGEKPKKAGAVCTWAWIGFAANILITIL